MIEPRKLPEGTATTTVFSLEPSAWLEKLCEDRDGVVRAWAKKLIYFVAPVNSAAAYLKWKQETDPMFERFTDRARRVMSLAQQEAQRFNHDHVGVQHVLLGLVKEGSGLAANALQNLGVGLRAVRVETERLNLPSAAVAMPELVMGKLPLTPGCEELVRDAGKASIRLKHKHVGTEHLLLSLAGADDASPAVRVLAALGVKRSAVQTAVMELIGDPAKMLKTGNLPAGAVALDAVNARLQEQAETEKDECGVDPAAAGADKTAHGYLRYDKGTRTFTVTQEPPADPVLPIPGSAWGFGDNPDPDAWAKVMADVNDGPDDAPPPEVLHVVRGRNYTDRAFELTLDAAVRLLVPSELAKPTEMSPGLRAAAEAFLTDLFGGPADEKAR